MIVTRARGTPYAPHRAGGRFFFRYNGYLVLKWRHDDACVDAVVLFVFDAADDGLNGEAMAGSLLDDRDPVS